MLPAAAPGLRPHRTPIRGKPRYKGLGIGTEVEFLHRSRNFEFLEVGFVPQRASQWCFFLTWNPRSSAIRLR